MSTHSDINQAQAATETKQTDKDYNFAQLRKQLETERTERQRAEQRMAQLEQERLQAQSNKADVDDDDNDEPYVDKKALKRQFDKFSQNIDQKIDKKAEEKARAMVEQERQNYFLKANPDFSQILNPDLIQKFAEKHPEIAEPMLEMPDNFARQKLLYQNIKALGLHKAPEAKENIQDKIDKNRRSPYYQPSSAGATPPYAAAGDFSSTGQKNAYQKMQELINNRRSF
jgi:hypothetical protein